MARAMSLSLTWYSALRAASACAKSSTGGGVLGLHAAKGALAVYFNQVKVEAWRKAIRRAIF